MLKISLNRQTAPKKIAEEWLDLDGCHAGAECIRCGCGAAVSGDSAARRHCSERLVAPLPRPQPPQQMQRARAHVHAAWPLDAHIHPADDSRRGAPLDAARADQCVWARRPLTRHPPPRAHRRAHSYCRPPLTSSMSLASLASRPPVVATRAGSGRVGWVSGWVFGESPRRHSLPPAGELTPDGAPDDTRG